MAMFGLADVNSFYANCEMLFRSDLTENGKALYTRQT